MHHSSRRSCCHPRQRRRPPKQRPLYRLTSKPAAPPPHYVVGAASATTPDPHSLLGHLRAIGVVVADTWAEAVRDLAIDAQLVTSMPAAGVKCWRIDGDLMKWVDLIRHGIQHRHFSIPVQSALSQQRAA